MKLGHRILSRTFTQPSTIFQIRRLSLFKPVFKNQIDRAINSPYKKVERSQFLKPDYRLPNWVTEPSLLSPGSKFRIWKASTGCPAGLRSRSGGWDRTDPQDGRIRTRTRLLTVKLGHAADADSHRRSIPGSERNPASDEGHLLFHIFDNRFILRLFDDAAHGMRPLACHVTLRSVSAVMLRFRDFLQCPIWWFLWYLLYVCG